MNFNLSKALQNLEAKQQHSEKCEALYIQFPHEKTFRIKAEGVAAFLQDHAVTDGKSFGLVVDGQVVEGDDHMLALLGDRSEITIEFRSIGLEHGGVDEVVCQWLEHVERHGG